jgi:hypothetical protein
MIASLGNLALKSRASHDGNPRVLWRQAVALAAVLATVLLVQGSLAVFYVALALWALGGTKHAIQALSVSVILTFLNPALFPASEAQSMLRWMVLLAAILRIYFDVIVLRYRPVVPSMLGFLLLFCLAAFATSMIGGGELSVSIVKIVVFFAGASAAILGFRLTVDLHEYWKSWFFTLFAVVLLLSLPTLFVDEIGRETNRLGFQGILSQPQSFGTFLAPIVAWLTALSLFRRKGVDWPILVCGGLGWVFLFETGARTAFTAVVLSLLVLFMIALLLRKDWIDSLSRTLSERKTGLLLYFALILFLFTFPLWQPALMSFVFKTSLYGAEATVGEAFERSRGFLIAKSLDNFAENPWTGIGFAIPSDLSTLDIQRDPIFGLPIGAAIEKGFLPSAVLEEVGIIGAFFFLVLILSLSVPVIRSAGAPMACMFLTCLFVNNGEMVFFSLGGLGLFTWLLIGLTSTSDACRGHEYKRRA